MQIGLADGVYATVATYDFEAQAGSSTPFSITNNGVTATFTSPADPGGFTVVATFFPTLPGNVLLETAPPGTTIPLDIAFSEPISSISLLFGLGTQDTSIVLDLTTDAGGSTSAAGSLQPSGFSEGSLSFSGTPFMMVELSASVAFGIDDVMVTTSAVAAPEPATWSLLGAGLAVLALVRLRRPVDILPGV